ncbi:putative septation protein SpoVG [Clostridia bacterium]|nr:putative septation protein SpoVG [Clostridia bacterium]
MTVSDIKIRYVNPDPASNVLAILSVVIDEMLALHDIKIIRGGERLFVAMPCRRDEKGHFHDIVHPINAEARQMLESAILAVYTNHIATTQAMSYEDSDITESAYA